MTEISTTPKRSRHRKKQPMTGNLPPMPHIEAGKTTTPRQTLPTNANILGSFPYAFLPRRQYQSVDLSSVNVSLLSPQQVIDLLSDADPDVSLAWWNFLLLTVGQWTIDARSPQDQEDPAAKDALNEILSMCNAQWGGFQNILYQWVMSVLLEGACSGETIPSEDLKDVHDVVPVTPWTIYFQRDANQDLVVYQWQPMLANGQVNTTGQPPTIASVANAAMSAAGFRLMNTTTFGYVPFMPMVDDPYGRMPFASIFQVIVFDNQLLQDLRRWAHVNAWGRIDVSIVQEMVQKLMPAAVQADKREIITFLNTYFADVAKSYNNIGPDDTFIHLDNVKVSSVDSSGKTMQIDSLIKAVERKKFRALRMLPILMGSNEGTTETHGTVQWDIMARGIEGIQTTVSTLANRLLTVALRLRGFTAHAELLFESVRASDRKADAVAEAIEIKNWAAKRDEGWVTQDEASIALTGSPAVAPAPNPDNYVAVNMGVPGNPPAVLPTPAAPGNTSDDGTTTVGDGADSEDATTKVTTTPRERAVMAAAMMGMLHKLITPTRVKKAPSAARVARQTSFTASVAAHFRGITIGAPTVANIVETHTSRFLARSKRFDPDLVDGVGAVIALRDGGITPLTADQRAAMKANIARMLADDIPDSDEDFTDEIAAARQDGYTLGGQEGADVVGLVGTFILTNAVILAQMITDARSHVQSIQSTTRDQLATAALIVLEDGGDSATLLDVLTARLEAMAGARSDGIASYEVAQGYWLGTRDVWGKNGVPSKSWGTNGDPDPHTGASGETPCIDNEEASPIPMDQTFPSGDSEPPAHLLCECFIEPEGSPDEAAMIDPWLGD